MVVGGWFLVSPVWLADECEPGTAGEVVIHSASHVRNMKTVDEI